jgi:hypothetical protein
LFLIQLASQNLNVRRCSDAESDSVPLDLHNFDRDVAVENVAIGWIPLRFIVVTSLTLMVIAAVSHAMDIGNPVTCSIRFSLAVGRNLAFWSGLMLYARAAALAYGFGMDVRGHCSWRKRPLATGGSTRVDREGLPFAAEKPGVKNSKKGAAKANWKNELQRHSSISVAG